MEIAMANNRPETEDGWKDGWAYSHTSAIGFSSTAYTTLISCDFPATICIEGVGTSPSSAGYMWYYKNGKSLGYVSLYNRTLAVEEEADGFVFKIPVQYKNTLKITDVSHNVVLFANGHPESED